MLTISSSQKFVLLTLVVSSSSENESLVIRVRPPAAERELAARKKIAGKWAQKWGHFDEGQCWKTKME